MSEIRRDSIVDRWVIFARNRAERPNEYAAPPASRSGKKVCPFCEGNEHLTPHEIAAYRTEDSAAEQRGWRVRVIPNKFPAVVCDSPADTADPAAGLTAGYGVHEVIVESPRHLLSTTELSDGELAEVLLIYGDRLRSIRQNPRIRHALVFKNVGPGAGASIEHTHSQLVGLPLVPATVAQELDAALTHYRQHGRCIFCDLVKQELAAESRMVFETESFVAFCPYAARFPLETWILPKCHASQYEESATAELHDLARVLRRCIDKIERAAGQSQYNYLIHSAPFDTRCQSHYHWHIEIFPRTTTIAGFEWGTGQFINPLPPEDAAKLLR